MVLVPTVPHSGSHFVVTHLLHGWHDWPLRAYDGALVDGTPWDRTKKPDNPPPVCRFDHLYSAKMPLWRELLGKYPAIVPLRHPRQVCRTYRKRHESLITAVEGFYNLVTIVDTYPKVFYLPLDVPNRQTYLDNINTCLGESFETDWPVVSSRPRTSAEWEWNDKDEAIYQTIWSAHKDFFERFWEG